MDDEREAVLVLVMGRMDEIDSRTSRLAELADLLRHCIGDLTDALQAHDIEVSAEVDERLRRLKELAALFL